MRTFKLLLSLLFFLSLGIFSAWAQPNWLFQYTPIGNNQMMIEMSEDYFSRMMSTGLRGSGLSGNRQPGTILWRDANTAAGVPAVRCKIGRLDGRDPWLGIHGYPAGDPRGRTLLRQFVMTCAAEPQTVVVPPPPPPPPPQPQSPPLVGSSAPATGCCVWSAPNVGRTCGPDNPQNCQGKGGNFSTGTVCVLGRVTQQASCCRDSWGNGC